MTGYPQPNNMSEEQLLRQAQHALFQAKMQGKNRLQQYDIQREQSTRALTGKLHEIKHALLADEFVLYYQPKVNMASGVVLGAEALIRWRKPSGEIVPPSDFLPIIQDHPLEIELGDWVIRTALAQLETWCLEGLDLELSVNVTSLQILEDAFVSKLAAALEAYPGVSPQALQIEILESSALHDLDKVTRIMQACRNLGVRFALDDFGTGYSSLAYLKHLPANTLKVDQSFVRNMLENSDDLSIISGVVGMAQAFGLQVLAEGVETKEHGDLLLRLGCELGQGYGIARPLPAEDLKEWILDWQAPGSWKAQKPVDFHNLPLLYAEVEHRHWVTQLEQGLEDCDSQLPPLDPSQCKVGRWIDNKGRNYYSLKPGFASLVEYHEALHRAGEQVVGAQAKGDIGEVKRNLSVVYALREKLFSVLRSLGSNS